MSKTENNEGASKHRFRRTQKSQERKRKAARDDSRFMNSIFGIIAFATLVVFMIVYVVVNDAAATELASTAQGAAIASEAAADSFMTKPIAGKYTPMDVLGIAFVLGAGYAVWLRYKNRE